MGGIPSSISRCPHSIQLWPITGVLQGCRELYSGDLGAVLPCAAKVRTYILALAYHCTHNVCMYVVDLGNVLEICTGLA